MQIIICIQILMFLPICETYHIVLSDIVSKQVKPNERMTFKSFSTSLIQRQYNLFNLQKVLIFGTDLTLLFKVIQSVCQKMYSMFIHSLSMQCKSLGLFKILELQCIYIQHLFILYVYLYHMPNYQNTVIYVYIHTRYSCYLLAFLWQYIKYTI